MANLDVSAILTGTAADLVIVQLDIIKLQALMADTHLSSDAHAAIQVLLDKLAVRRHILEGMQGRAQALSDDGYPDYPSGDLLHELKAQILAELQTEEDMVNAEQEAINKLFEVIGVVTTGTIDFAPPITKGG